MKKILLTLFTLYLSISVFADFTGDYDVSNWTLTLTNSDGTVNTAGAPGFIEITSSDLGGGGSGNTDYTITVPQDTTITFSWAYSTTDGSTWDYPLELINGDATVFPNFDMGGPNTQGGVLSIRVAAGDAFGFRMYTVDNLFGRATLTISNFELTPPPPDVVTPIDDITQYVGAADTELSLFDIFEDVVDHDTDLVYTIVGNSDPSVVTPSAISSSDGLLMLNYGAAGNSLITIKVENLSGGFVTEIFEVEVEKYTLTIMADAQTRTYGAANPALTMSFDGFVDGDDESVLDFLPAIYTDADETYSVGEYTIYVVGGDDDKYTYQRVYSILSITPAPLTVTADSYSRDYGDANPTLTYSYSGFVNGEDYTILDVEPAISTLADASSDAGDYEITLSGGVDSNYEFIYVHGTLTVLKIELTVTAYNRLKTYGEANPTLNYEYAGFVNGDDASDIDVAPLISTDATELSDVGAYDIVVSGGSDNNYNFHYVWGTLNISKADLAAQADDQSKEYGETNPEFTVTYTGFVNDDAPADIDTPPVAATSADETSIPGTYAITLTGGADNNYNMINTDGTLTVSKAILSAVADDKEKSYSDPNPALTISYTGFVNGESEADLDMAPTVSTLADASSNAGSYPITLSGGSDANYDIILTDGSLTINPVDLEITAEDKTKVYGEAVPDLTYTITGFVAGEDESVLTSPVAISTIADETTDAGIIPITVSGAEAANYNIIFNPGELTITKVTLTATADDMSRGYGEPNPLFTVSYEGFVNADDASVIDEAPAGSTTADESSSLGTYDITLSGGSDNNYDFTYVSGTLTIEKADQTITFDALDDVTILDEDFDPGAVASSGLEVSYVSSNPDIAAITPEGLVQIVTIGTVTITASQAGDDNYNAAIDVEQSLTITKVDQTITFEALADATVGDADIDPGATASSGLDVTYASSDPDVAEITGDGMIRIVAEGTVTITASQAGDDTYNAAPDVEQTLTVNEEPDALNSMSITALSIYPNPSQGELTIGSTEAGEEIALKVFDLTGNVVASSDYEITPCRLFIGKEGIYIIQIENKGVITTNKIIVE